MNYAEPPKHGISLGDSVVFYRCIGSSNTPIEGLVTAVSDRFLRVQYRAFFGLQQKWISIYVYDDPNRDLVISKVRQ